jgi:type II secretory pathway pseudopilin PulG
MHHMIARARDEGGFTMVTVMAVMFCVTLLSIAALSAAQGDLKPGAHDKSRKIAYAAAEAGVQNYLYHLAQDPNYWAKCTTGSGPHAINDPWNGTSPAADPRTWRTVPSSQARYTIELLPANGAAACSTASPDATMIDTGSGTFKIRATGEDLEDGVKRSIIASFKRKSFLDYLYFTDKETRAGGLYGMNAAGVSEEAGTGRDIVTWARAECDRYWGDDSSLGNRHVPRYIGTFTPPGGGVAQALDYTCNEGEFKAGDEIKGPLHTNDEILIECTGTPPRFGRTPQDAIETSSLGQTAVTPADSNGGWRDCSPPIEPEVNFGTATNAGAGTWKPRAAALQLPVTNSSLKRDAAAANRFVGTTKIVLNGTTMNVDGVDKAIPADGVVYVSNSGSCPEYNAVDTAVAPDTCGNLEIEGDYAVNVTFAAENDIVITDDLERTSGSQVLLGLIATNYVRVHHPVTDCDTEVAGRPVCNYLKGCENAPGSPQDVSITGAVLSLTKSFMVDNWFCGDALGTLHFKGAIAQKFRGPVSRLNVGTERPGFAGYLKDYEYDDQLRYRSPPKFLDPVAAQWRVQTFSEQVPAR